MSQPPPITRTVTKPFPSEHQRILRLLRKRRGEWVRVAREEHRSRAAGLAVAIRTGRYRAFRDLAYESTIRTNRDTGLVEVWARMPR